MMNFITRCHSICHSNTISKINPDFYNLRGFIESIPQTFEMNGKTIRCVRNHIKILHINGKLINIKKYAVPPLFINRIIYVLFRQPKAKRHYDYALKLQSLGIDSPTPIGYYLQKNGLLLSNCYLATEHKDNIYRLSDLNRVNAGVKAKRVLIELGRYTALLHKRGIFHHDYSSGNILFHIEDGIPKFTLVDINRMSFHQATFDAGCKNFHRLKLSPKQFKIVANSYAEAMSYDKERTYLRILHHRNNRSKMFNLKCWIKTKNLFKFFSLK